MRSTTLVLVLTSLALFSGPASAVQLGTPRASGAGPITTGPGAIGAVRQNGFGLRNTTPGLSLRVINGVNAQIKPTPTSIPSSLSETTLPPGLETTVLSIEEQPVSLTPAQEVSRIAADIAPDLEGLSDQRGGLEQTSGSGGNISERLQGRRVQSGVGALSLEPSGKAAPDSSLRPYSAREIASPLGFFEHAKAIALARAQAMGYGPEKVYFGEATAYLPGRIESSWIFTFHLIQHPAQTHVDEITVLFKKAGLVSRGDEIEIADDPSVLGSLKTRYVVKEYVHPAAPLPARRFPAPLDNTFFAQGTRINPDKALELLRKTTSRVGRDVSLSLRMRKPDASGAQDLWYYVYDAEGATFVVNGRTGEILERSRVGKIRSQATVENASRPWSISLILTGLSFLMAAGLLWGLLTSLFDS